MRKLFLSQPSRWRDVPSGAVWGWLAGVPTYVATLLMLVGCLQIVGAFTGWLIVVAAALSFLAGLLAAYYASAWYFRRKSQQLFSWAIETPPTPPQPANHWYSFSLQRLFVAQFVLIFVLALWVGARREHIAWVYQQRREMAEWQAYQESLKMRFDGFGWQARDYWPPRLSLDQFAGTMLVNFDDRILERIEPNDHLERIHIRSDSLTDVGLETLSRHAELVEVEIQSNQVTDAGIAHLRKLPLLQRVQLTCPKLTAQSLDELQTLKSLKKVTLYKSTIPWQRKNEFKQARPEVSILVLP
jgi:hypothetical protein